MENIKQQISVAEALLVDVKNRPGNTGPKQLALLENLLGAVKNLAALIENGTTPSA